MEITNEAKEIIQNILKENDFEVLSMYTDGAGCSKSLSFDLLEKKNDVTYEEINGIFIIMDEETRDWTKELIIDAKEGNLVLHNPNGGCGCGDHGHDHDHDEEDGCGGCCGGCH